MYMLLLLTKGYCRGGWWWLWRLWFQFPHSCERKSQPLIRAGIHLPVARWFLAELKTEKFRIKPFFSLSKMLSSERGENGFGNFKFQVPRSINDPSFLSQKEWKIKITVFPFLFIVVSYISLFCYSTRNEPEWMILNTAEPAYSYIVYSRFLVIVELKLVPFAPVFLLFYPCYSRLLL